MALGAQQGSWGAPGAGFSRSRWSGPNSANSCVPDDRQLTSRRDPAASASANRYHHIEETRVHRFVVSSNGDSGRSFRSRSLNEQIQYADDRVAFVRSGRVREKNLFPNTGTLPTARIFESLHQSAVGKGATKPGSRDRAVDRCGMTRRPLRPASAKNERSKSATR